MVEIDLRLIDQYDPLTKELDTRILTMAKAQKTSLGKVCGTAGERIGNAHLWWAFMETALPYLRGNRLA